MKSAIFRKVTGLQRTLATWTSEHIKSANPSILKGKCIVASSMGTNAARFKVASWNRGELRSFSQLMSCWRNCFRVGAGRAANMLRSEELKMEVPSRPFSRSSRIALKLDDLAREERSRIKPPMATPARFSSYQDVNFCTPSCRLFVPIRLNQTRVLHYSCAEYAEIERDGAMTHITRCTEDAIR